MKDKWPCLLLITLVVIPVAAFSSTPSPEFLELLGQFSALEDQGVDVDQQIEAHQQPGAADSLQRERDQPAEPEPEPQQ